MSRNSAAMAGPWLPYDSVQTELSHRKSADGFKYNFPICLAGVAYDTTGIYCRWLTCWRGGQTSIGHCPFNLVNLIMRAICRRVF